MHPSRSFARVCASLALTVTIGAALPGTSSAAEATAPLCTDLASGATTLSATLPVCVSQQGNIVIVVVGNTGTPASPASTALPIPPLTMPAADARSGTYAQRQAIRDRYRGQIDELNFNDDLGDGVSLEQALSDALAARPTLQKRSLP